jgi:hypothetical protein
MTLKSLEGMIFTADVPWRLFFYSNGSTDDTAGQFNRIAPTWAWQYFCGYQFLHRTNGYSLAAAWNDAFNRLGRTTEGHSEYTMFANNDIEYYKAGWMSRLIQMLDGGFDLAGIQEMTWYRFRFVEGSLLVARTATLEALKEDGRLFDIRFKLSCEDVDLSHRFLQAGMRIGQAHGLQPEYLVHIGHQTINAVGAQEDLVGAMHTSRRALCKKWRVPQQVED